VGTLAAVTQAAPLLTSVPALRGLWPTLAGRGQQGRVALTFDDGPDGASTPAFLEALAKASVHATFFLLGEMVERFPDLPRRMVDEGHELAVHSWDHRNHLRVVPGRRMSEQLVRTADLIEQRTGRRPTYFRPPYGAFTAAAAHAARKAGLQPVLWTAWGKDWSAKATPASVVGNVTRTLRSGGTVLLHDSDCTSAPGAWRSALGALPTILDWCEERGLRVGPLREHGLPSRSA
jgi:peptidoglycan/xylan/chitin deacetylase (PgdA/CDA1 family)